MWAFMKVQIMDWAAEFDRAVTKLKDLAPKLPDRTLPNDEDIKRRFLKSVEIQKDIAFQSKLSWIKEQTGLLTWPKFRGEQPLLFPLVKYTLKTEREGASDAHFAQSILHGLKNFPVHVTPTAPRGIAELARHVDNCTHIAAKRTTEKLFCCHEIQDAAVIERMLWYTTAWPGRSRR